MSDKQHARLVSVRHDVERPPPELVDMSIAPRWRGVKSEPKQTLTVELEWYGEPPQEILDFVERARTAMT